MARAGEVSMRVCQSPTKFSEIEVSFFHNGSSQSVGWLYRTKKDSEAWFCQESSVSVLQGWEPLVLGARHRDKPVQKNYCYSFC